MSVSTTKIEEKSTTLIKKYAECNGTTLTNGNGNNKRTYSSLEVEDGEEEDKEFTPTPAKIPVTRKQTCYAAYRKIQHTSTVKVTAERGLIHDFKHELHYLLTTIFDENSTVNLKNLSLIQLLKKSMSPEFRDFLRAQANHVNKLFAVLKELTSSPMISLSTACLLYFMARDRKGLPISEHCVRLISELLKQQSDSQQRTKVVDEEFTKHQTLIWSIMQDWLRFWLNKSTKQVKFDVTQEQLSTPYLTLEALAYIALKEQSKMFKSELLTSGCLSSVIAKLDKVALELVHSPTPKDTGTRLKVIERCYRILENAAAFDQRNQTFLIQHRNNLLIFSSAKFLNFSLKFIEDGKNKQASTSNEPKSSEQEEWENAKVFDCICLLCRVLMNISHENENAAQKIGQVAGFLGNCLHMLAQHSIYAPREKQFDLAVMMYGLLVNLLERCAANRRKFLTLKANLIDKEGKTTTDVPALEVLTKLFIKHDSAAKTVDEEFDQDLVAEEYEEPGNNGGGQQQQERAANMSQDEVMAAIQTLMSKASTHMEDSMIASYCSLVLAILVGTDQNLAEEVKAFLPANDMTPMLEQLERFLEFMRITKLKTNTVNNIERLLRSLQIASSSSSSVM